MNWGNKLLLVFFVFGAMIAFMVYRCMRSSADLVSADYYKDELAYQEVINGKMKAAALSNKVSVGQQHDRLLIQLPREMKNQHVSGNIWFYCASNSEKDKRIVLNTDEDGSQEIAVKYLGSGSYTMKVRWQLNGNEYFSEQPLIIP